MPFIFSIIIYYILNHHFYHMIIKKGGFFMFMSEKDGSYWGDGRDLSDEDKKIRKSMLRKKPPYELCIVTDVYAGNFERELIAFSIGLLDGVQEKIKYARMYIQAFWKYTENVHSYQEYKETIQRLNSNTTQAKIESLLNKTKIVEDEPDNDKMVLNLCSSIKSFFNPNRDEYAEFYENVLCNTYQIVDDWEQYTFYRIGQDYKNPDGNNLCNCIYIQLNQPLTGRFEELVVKRIHSFFDEDVLKTINRYISLCEHCKNIDNSLTTPKKLCRLELIDKQGNLINDYTDWMGF